MKLPPLQSLRSFEAVARLGSVMRAAEELFVTHSAVSQQIRKLEEWLGLTLFERSGRGLRLTGAGERFRLKVSEAFNLIDAEAQLLRRRDRSPAVRFSCISAFAASWLLPQMHDFWAKHRDVQLAIRYSLNLNAPDPAAVDVAVRMGQASQFPEFVAKPILESASFPFASPDYLQRTGYKDLSDLPRLALLHSGSRDAWRDWLLSAAAMGHDFRPGLARGGVVHPDGHLALSACLAGQGVVLLPRDLVLVQLHAEMLVQLSNISIFEDSYLLLTPRSRPLPRGALVFAEWMQSLPRTLNPGGARA